MVIHTEHVEDNVTREERIDLLKQYYLHVLVEDGIDGTDFDVAVLDALKKLEEKYRDPNKERKVGFHLGCGGNLIKRRECTWCDKCEQRFCGCACG
ncbi:MAG: hypothetical protein AAB630_03460 [Patescibacteria group bacterium]